jgi:HK97 family phage prohead protease
MHAGRSKAQSSLTLLWTKGSTVHMHSLPLFETRASAEGVIEGYGATFNGIDSHGDTIAPGAFTETLRRGMPLMLWQHRHDMPIGRWTEAREDLRGLFLRGQVNLSTAAGRDAFSHLRAHDINGLSIGYRIPPGGAERRGGVHLVKAVDLGEVSIVSLPSDPRARVTAVKAERPGTLRELQHALQELGYSRREAAAIAQKGFAGLELDDDSQQLDALLEQLRAVRF